MINRESTNLSAIDTIEMDGHWCKTETGVNTDGCKILMKARPWYWVLLLAADLALVLCGFVSLLLFADWMLYVVLVRDIGVVHCHRPSVLCTNQSLLIAEGIWYSLPRNEIEKFLVMTYMFQEKLASFL